MVVVQVWEGVWVELEGILESDLVLLEAVHVVQIIATSFMVSGRPCALMEAKVGAS